MKFFTTYISLNSKSHIVWGLFFLNPLQFTINKLKKPHLWSHVDSNV